MVIITIGPIRSKSFIHLKDRNKNQRSEWCLEIIGTQIRSLTLADKAWSTGIHKLFQKLRPRNNQNHLKERRRSREAKSSPWIGTWRDLPCTRDLKVCLKLGTLQRRSILRRIISHHKCTRLILKLMRPFYHHMITSELVTWICRLYQW